MQILKINDCICGFKLCCLTLFVLSNACIALYLHNMLHYSSSRGGRQVLCHLLTS